MGDAVSFLSPDIHVQIGEGKGAGSAGYVATREKSEAKYVDATSVMTHTDPVVYVQHIYGHRQDNRASAQVTDPLAVRRRARQYAICQVPPYLVESLVHCV